MLMLYCTKCMHEAQQPHSSTSLPNQWLPARKVVPPLPVKDVNFALTKVRKCQSAFQLPKNLKHSTKTASNLDLRDLSENNQEEFCAKLSSQLDYHPNILSIHHKFDKPFCRFHKQCSFHQPSLRCSRQLRQSFLIMS